MSIHGWFTTVLASHAIGLPIMVILEALAQR